MNDFFPALSTYAKFKVTGLDDNGVLTAVATPNPPANASQQILQLLPMTLINKADPAKGHASADTPIAFKSSATDNRLDAIAWIAAQDTATNNLNNPRMPELVAQIGAPSGTMVWWKLSVIFHDRNGNPYRDFDTGTTPNGPQTTQLTNTAENGSVGYSDNIAIPLPTGSADSGAISGWEPLAAGTPWTIYQDQDWKNAVARGFFGGDAVLSVKVTSSDGTTVIMPEQDFMFRIAGENPVASVCESYINTTYNGPTPNWQSVVSTGTSTPPTVPGYWFAYAIAKEETDGDGGRTYYNNFLDNGGALTNKAKPWLGHEGRPDWNNDGSSGHGSGGYGLFQLTFGSDETNFIMPRDWIWNWQTNVKQFLPIIKQDVSYTQSYLNYIKAHNSSSYVDPSSLTTTADTTTFNFWESSVITLNNGASILPPSTVGGNLGAWRFTSSSAQWAYVPNGSPGYLYNVARKGVENHP